MRVRAAQTDPSCTGPAKPINMRRGERLYFPANPGGSNKTVSSGRIPGRSPVQVRAGLRLGSRSPFVLALGRQGRCCKRASAALFGPRGARRCDKVDESPSKGGVGEHDVAGCSNVAGSGSVFNVLYVLRVPAFQGGGDPRCSLQRVLKRVKVDWRVKLPMGLVVTWIGS